MAEWWREPLKLYQEKKSQITVAASLAIACQPVIETWFKSLLYDFKSLAIEPFANKATKNLRESKDTKDLKDLKTSSPGLSANQKLSKYDLCKQYFDFGIAIGQASDVICLSFRNQTIYRKVISEVLRKEIEKQSAFTSKIQNDMSMVWHLIAVEMNNRLSCNNEPNLQNLQPRDSQSLQSSRDQLSCVSSTDLHATLNTIDFLYKHSSLNADIFEYNTAIYAQRRLASLDPSNTACASIVEFEHDIAFKFSQENPLVATTQDYILYNRLNLLIKDCKDSIQLSKTFNKNCRWLWRDIGVSNADDVSFPKTYVSVFSKKSQHDILALNLPTSLVVVQNEYKKFYDKSFQQRRKLMWSFTDGHCEIDLLTIHGPQTIETSLIQAVILECFNSKSVWFFKDLVDRCCDLRTVSSGKTLFKNHLMSLAHPRLKILMKNPPSPQLENTHLFKLNPNFKIPTSFSSNSASSASLNSVFQVPVIQIASDTLQRNEGFERWMVNQLDRVLLYILKGTRCKPNKSITHKNLVIECISRFQSENPTIPPCYMKYASTQKLALKISPSHVRARILAFIEQEFITRDPNNRELYYYNA